MGTPSTTSGGRRTGGGGARWRAVCVPTCPPPYVPPPSPAPASARSRAPRRSPASPPGTWTWRGGVHHQRHPRARCSAGRRSATAVARAVPRVRPPGRRRPRRRCVADGLVRAARLLPRAPGGAARWPPGLPPRGRAGPPRRLRSRRSACTASASTSPTWRTRRGGGRAGPRPGPRGAGHALDGYLLSSGGVVSRSTPRCAGSPATRPRSSRAPARRTRSGTPSAPTRRSPSAMAPALRRRRGRDRAVRKDGARMRLALTATACRPTPGLPLWAVLLRDVTASAAAAGAGAAGAHRRAHLAAEQPELPPAARAAVAEARTAPLSLAVLDLDRFKAVNDRSRPRGRRRGPGGGGPPDAQAVLAAATARPDRR